MKSYVIVEGHGEMEAVQDLLTRLVDDLGLTLPFWATPVRGPGMTRAANLQRACELIRSRLDAAALLVLRDDDDGCPKDDGPLLSVEIAELALPFPTACVLAFREYESLFLPCVSAMAGKRLDVGQKTERPGLRSDASFTGNPEGPRGVKGLLSRMMPEGRSYKPTLDQLAFTRMVDFPMVRQSELPWFGTLERALCFLGSHLGATGTYPPPPKAA